MGNVDFSEMGYAMKRNRPLLDHLIERMKRPTPLKVAKGEIEVVLKYCDDVRTVTFPIGKRDQKLVDFLSKKETNLCAQNNKNTQPL
jgi:hypothetical protein